MLFDDNNVYIVVELSPHHSSDVAALINWLTLCNEAVHIIYIIKE